MSTVFTSSSAAPIASPGGLNADKGGGGGGVSSGSSSGKKSKLKKLSRVAEFSESFMYKVEDWRSLSANTGVGELADKTERTYIYSPVYHLFGIDWVIKIGPYNDLMNLSIRLVNMSDKDIDIKYEFTLINHKNRLDNIVWGDPEGIITFEGAGDCKNNEWGNDDFISYPDLIDDVYGFLDKNGTLVWNVYMEVYSELEPHLYPLSRAISTAAETHDLIDVANKDLSLVVKNLPFGQSKDVNRQQDDLISYRLKQQSSAISADEKIARRTVVKTTTTPAAATTAASATTMRRTSSMNAATVPVPPASMTTGITVTATSTLAIVSTNLIPAASSADLAKEDEEK